ncbi:lantibiotic dehydratase [Kitasatospora nipponensis]|uniref:Lantibiotic dehydratase n=1 Tax=Kitasatospora nipponensis TaxID=258049 RepID=A0ABN1X0T7_9ACTN
MPSSQPSEPALFRPAPVALLRAPIRGHLCGPARAAAPPPGPLDRAACEELLRGAAGDGLFMDALRVASPSLARLVESSARPQGLAARSDAQLRRAAVSVVRYEVRLRSRCTPFGLFAGVAPVRVGEAASAGGSAVKVSWSQPATSRTRVDLDWLFGLIQRLEREGGLLPHLPLHAHAGIIPRGGRLVMAAPSNPGAAAGDAARSEVSVRVTLAVTAALALATAGTTGGAAIAELTRRFPQAPPGAAARLLATLVRQEFLITGLRPVLDGGDPLTRVIGVLAEVERSAGRPLPLLAALRAIAADRDRYDAAVPGARRTELAALEDGMRRLADSERLVHVDVALGAEVRLPQAVADEAARALGVLWRLSAPGPGLPPMRGYHRDFLERYGTDRVVPVLEALDETVGIGAPAGYAWPPSARSEEPGRPADRARDLLLGRLAAAAVREGSREVVLDDALVARLAPAQPDRARLPRSCELFGSLVAADERALSAGDFLLVGGSGPGPAEAGATFGRFAGLAGPVNEELAAIAFPEAPDALHLAVAYQPRTTRALNIANSPRTATHQVAVGLPPDPGAIPVPLDEIGVAATLDHLYPVHLPTGRRLLPHAHHALDVRGQAPNVARFLLELGRDASRMYTPWDWGPAGSAPLLPRVRYGRVVLASATWRLDELREQTGLDPADWPAAVAGWRQRWGAPERIVLTRYDHRLPLDLTDPWHLEVLRDALAKDGELTAVELPGGEDRPNGWLRDAAGEPHLAELALAFVRAPAPAPATAPGQVPVQGQAAEPVAAPPPRHPGPRLAEPGGEWLYAKLYLSGRQTEAFLCEQLTPFLAGLPSPAKELIDRWFYLRYRDQDDHLRLRFHGPAQGLWRELVPALRTAVREWSAQGLVGRCVLDGYDPEWERYGGPGAQAAAERFFAADSRTALTLLRIARQPAPRPGPQAGSAHDGEPGWDRETLAALSLASIAHAVGAAPAAQPAAPPAAPPATVPGPLRHQEPDAAWLAGSAIGAELPAGFRAQRARWLRLIDPAAGWPALAEHPPGAPLLALLADQADQLRAYRARLDELAAAGESWSPLPRVVAGLLHMSCNRLLGPDREAERRAHALARACVIGNADRRKHQR